MTTNEHRVIEKPRNPFFLKRVLFLKGHTQNLKQPIACVCGARSKQWK